MTKVTPLSLYQIIAPRNKSLLINFRGIATFLNTAVIGTRSSENSYILHPANLSYVEFCAMNHFVYQLEQPISPKW